MKKQFEKSGNIYRFSRNIDEQEKKFEFYHEPFRGTLHENIDLFIEMFNSSDVKRRRQGIHLIAQTGSEKAIPYLVAAV